MSRAQVLLSVAPLGLTLWVLVVVTAVVLVVIAIGVTRHLATVRADRHREQVHAELGPVFARFLGSYDPAVLGAELRPAFMRMNAAQRPVAAVLVTEVMQRASSSQAELLRDALEQSGIVELGERGTRRRSPWRRALACEMLGKIGSPRAVPALLDRLEDRRPEVRMAAVRALGDIGSPEAVPALTDAFLHRRAAPIDVVNDALRRIGPDALNAFERGVASEDPFVRVSSCFGLSAMTHERAACAFRLATVLDLESEMRVRTAAAAALGILGGDDAPAALTRAAADPEVHVRRSAVKALGSFDDPATGAVLTERTDDEDRETAIRAAEALLALTRRPRAAPDAQARVEASSAWAVEYARKVAEVSA